MRERSWWRAPRHRADRAVLIMPLAVLAVSALHASEGIAAAQPVARPAPAAAPHGDSTRPPRRPSRLPPDADSIVAPPRATLGDGTRQVDGRVIRGDTPDGTPVRDAWVTLHRVGPDGAGPLDSTRTGGEGTFAFRFRPTGNAEALYFASTTYGGVAYFTPPLARPINRDEGAELMVFDTTSRALKVGVRGRHVVVAPVDSAGVVTVVEVYELSNDTSLTLVAGRDSARGVWSAPLPAEARDFRVVRGDVPTEALVPTANRAVLLAPFAPGLRQVGFSYTIRPDAFPITLRVEQPTTVLEVLVGDPRGTVEGARLVGVEPVLLEQRQYRRFLGQDVNAGATLTVGVPGPSRRWDRLIVPALLVAIGGGMVAALMRAQSRRTAASSAPAAAPSVDHAAGEGDAARLAREIAALDDAHARSGVTDGEARVAYERRRAELKASLARALAADADGR